MLCALLTYQPAAMLFWVFTAVEVLRRGEFLHRATRMLATRLGVAIAAMACGLFANRVGVHFYPSVYSGRSRLVDDVVEKISWFGREPLVNSLNLFDLVPAHSVAVAVAIVAAVGILLLHAGEGRGSFGFLALAAALVPLSYLPNLAIAENWASYRSVGALSALLTLYAWLGLWGISRALPTLGARSVRSVLAARAAAVALALLLSFVFLALIVVPLSHLHGPSAASGAVASAFGTWPRITLFVLFFVVLSAIAFAPSESTAKAVAAAAGRLAVAAFAITGVLLAARNVTTLFARPQNVELRMMQSMLATAPASPIRHVVFVKPFFREGAAPLVRYDEFGNPSSYFPWVPIPAVLLTLQEQRQQTMRPDIDVLAWDARTIPRSTGPGEVLVDMRKVRQRRVGWSLWALQTESTSAGYVAPDRAETRRR
jgi:hypothetical protein